MSDKELSGEEKRMRMKEQFKKELRERKEFADKVKNLRRLQNINSALDGMKLEDDSEQWIDRLNQETAFNEAKTEIALDSASQAAIASNAEAEIEEAVKVSDAEMQKIAAEEMVRKMKEEMAREAALGTTGGGGATSPPRNLLGDEKPAADTPEASAERPARKMMAGIAAEFKEVEKAPEKEAPDTSEEQQEPPAAES